MKRLIIITTLSCSLSALTINFSKEFETEIKPDTLQASVSIVEKLSTQDAVVNALARITNYLDTWEDIEKKGGNYSVRPNYTYENNKRYKDGYSGSIYYTFSSKDSKKLNKFLSNLYSFKAPKGEEISLNNINWIMSKEQKTGKVDALRLDAIKWSRVYAKSLSKDLSSKCSVKSVIFTPINYFQPQPMIREEMVAMDKAYMAPTPTQDKQKMSVNPTITIECK